MSAIEEILLIYPPSTQGVGYPHICAHPLGIACLGAVLKKDYKVNLLDATTENHRNVEDLGNGLIRYGLSDEEIKKRIAEHSQDVVGITCLNSSQMPFVRKFCQLAKEINPKIIKIFIIGFSGETKEQILRTFSFARKLRLNSAFFFIAIPLPGSKLYEICKQKGYLKDGFDFETINYSSSNYETPEFTSRELEGIRDKENFVFNLGLLFRNPIFFIKRYLLYLATNPLSIFELFRYRWIPVFKTYFLKGKT